MQEHEFIALAATPTVAVIREITDHDLEAPTPCLGWDVHSLIQHLLFYGPALECAARKEPTDFGDDELPADWQSQLEEQITRLVAAWSAPEAWQGATSMGGPVQMPAYTLGGMVLGELVVHGWDLAVATGNRPVWDEEMLGFLHQEVSKNAPLGRDMDVYGPEVPVVYPASTLDRTLALTGRTPRWGR
jgi:uncharacterized protein (TIGR03086 family)